MSAKSKLKEKILSWYDGLFELDNSLLYDHPNFWQEFFLLRPKSEYLSEKIKNLNNPQALQLLVDQCLEFASTGSTIQVANSLQTQVNFAASLMCLFFYYWFLNTDPGIAKQLSLIWMARIRGHVKGALWLADWGKYHARGDFYLLTGLNSNWICLVGHLSNRTILPKICLTGQFIFWESAFRNLDRTNCKIWADLQYLSF